MTSIREKKWSEWRNEKLESGDFRGNENTILILLFKKSMRRFYKKALGLETIPSDVDIDHIIDRQLGGSDEISNLWLLDRSVNRSLGKQIERAIREYPYGTKFGRFYFSGDE